MMIDRNQPGESMFELNMTPMIDIVFNLLMFFLVATRYAEIDRDMIVNPPTARNVRPVASMPQELVINVTDDGRMIVSQVEYTPADLDRLIARAVQENPNQAVVVRGDRRAILQLPVNVLNLCEKHGVKRKFLTTSNPGG